MGIFKRQKSVQSDKNNCVVENPDANQVVIRQLSTRFTNGRGNDAWSYLNKHRVAAFEILKNLSPGATPSSCFSGLASMNEIYSVAVNLDLRFRDESGESASQYLVTHKSMALELFKPTKVYEYAIQLRYNPELVQAALMQSIRRKEKPAPA